MRAWTTEAPYISRRLRWWPTPPVPPVDAFIVSLFIVASLPQVESTEGRVAAKQAELTALQAEFDKYQQDIAQDLDELEGQVDSLTAELKERDEEIKRRDEEILSLQVEPLCFFGKKPWSPSGTRSPGCRPLILARCVCCLFAPHHRVACCPCQNTVASMYERVAAAEEAVAEKTRELVDKCNELAESQAEVPLHHHHRRLQLPPLIGWRSCSMLAHTRRFLFFIRLSDDASLWVRLFDPRRWR